MMADDYYINLEGISLETYKKTLEQTDIVPSRKALKENTEERFQKLQQCGFKNLQDCLTMLKTAEKVKEISKKSGLSEHYLLLLKREINSLLPKPLQFKKIPDTKTEILKKLESVGIKNTRQLFNNAKTKKDRKTLLKQTGISDEDLMELLKMADLARIKWIGPIFTRLFFESGTDTADKVSKSKGKAKELFKKLKDVNERNNYTKANFTENDVQICIDVAKDVPKIIEY